MEVCEMVSQCYLQVCEMILYDFLESVLRPKLSHTCKVESTHFWSLSAILGVHVGSYSHIEVLRTVRAREHTDCWIEMTIETIQFKCVFKSNHTQQALNK